MRLCNATSCYAVSCHCHATQCHITRRSYTIRNIYYNMLQGIITISEYNIS